MLFVYIAATDTKNVYVHCGMLQKRQQRQKMFVDALQLCHFELAAYLDTMHLKAQKCTGIAWSSPKDPIDVLCYF